MLASSPQSHVYLINAEETLLIDTGFPGNAQKLLTEIQSCGLPPIQKILLTHNDVDHVGNASKLAEWTGAALFASGEDIPYIKGEKDRPGIKRFIGHMMKYPVPDTIHAFTPIQHFGELSMIPAPGHTPGHVIFLYQNALFSGDLFQYSHEKFSLLPKSMTWNLAVLKESIHLLHSLSFDWICPSHGLPVLRNSTFEDFLSAF